MKSIVSLITYVGPDNEIIITTPQLEKNTICDYFTKGKRNIDEYDRMEMSEAVVVTTRLFVS